MIAKAAVAYGTLSNTFEQVWECWEDYLELLGTTQEEMDDAELVFNKNRIDAAEHTDLLDKAKAKFREFVEKCPDKYHGMEPISLPFSLEPQRDPSLTRTATESPGTVSWRAGANLTTPVQHQRHSLGLLLQ